MRWPTSSSMPEGPASRCSRWPSTQGVTHRTVYNHFPTREAMNDRAGRSRRRGDGGLRPSRAANARLGGLAGADDRRRLRRVRRPRSAGPSLRDPDAREPPPGPCASPPDPGLRGRDCPRHRAAGAGDAARSHGRRAHVPLVHGLARAHRAARAVGRPALPPPPLGRRRPCSTPPAPRRPPERLESSRSTRR